jgi:tight adherence protein B
MSRLAFLAAGSLCLLAAIGLVLLALAQRARHAQLRRFVSMLALETAASPAGPPLGLADMLPEGLAQRFRRAGWAPSRNQALLLGSVLLLAMPVTAMTDGWLAALLLGCTAPLAGAMLAELRGQRRMRRLSDNMLGFLERVRQLLSVGSSLSVALARATENSPPIVTQSLTPTIRRISNGNGVAESLERCAVELDIYELHLLATAARTNLRFGGSMSQILRNIIENIRRRATVERELRAGTTEIRSSAWVLAALPLFVATIVMLTNSAYARWFLETGTGHKMIAYAIVSQLIGAWLMRLVTRTRY